MFHVSHLVHRSLILSHMQCFYLEKRRYFQYSISFNKTFSATFSLHKIASLLKEPFFLRQGSFNDPARGGLGTFNQGARLSSSNLAQLFLRREKSCAKKSFFWPEYEVFIPINCRPKKFTIISSKGLLVRFKITESRSTHHSDSFCEVLRKNP